MLVFNLFVEEEEFDVDIVKGEGGEIFGHFGGGEYLLVLSHVQLGDDDRCYFLDIALEVNDELHFLLPAQQLLNPVSPHFGHFPPHVFLLIRVHLAYALGSE